MYTASECSSSQSKPLKRLLQHLLRANISLHSLPRPCTVVRIMHYSLGTSEASQWHLGWQAHRTGHRPIPIKLTFSANSQEPIHSDDQCYVLRGQSHRCQYDHHGNQASLRDACCSDAGSSCCDTEWAVGGMERRAETFIKRETNKQHMCCGCMVGVAEWKRVITLCKWQFSFL